MFEAVMVMGSLMDVFIGFAFIFFRFACDKEVFFFYKDVPPGPNNTSLKTFSS